MSKKILVATEKPFAKVAVEGIKGILADTTSGCGCGEGTLAGSWLNTALSLLQALKNGELVSKNEILKLVLGIFLLLFSILSLAKPDFRFKSSPRNAVVGGGISGFLAGLIGTGGALRGAFLTAFNLKKEVYIATAAAIAIAVDITRIPIYFGSGFLKQQFYWYLPLLFGIAIAGSYVGKKIVNKIPQKSFRKFVLGVIALLSLKFIYDGVISLF